MPARKKKSTPAFRWNPRAGQYVRANGRFVPRAEVRAAIDTALAAESRRALRLSQELRSGARTLMSWRGEMRTLMKNVHLYNAAIARGGSAQLTQADYGRVGRILRTEYGFLESFARDLASGKQALDGRFLMRAQMYAQAGRSTYHAEERAVMRDAGYTIEWNILHPADHCAGCLGETARGRVRIGTLLPIGSRDCRRRCRCTLGFARR